MQLLSSMLFIFFGVSLSQSLTGQTTHQIMFQFEPKLAGGPVLQQTDHPAQIDKLQWYISDIQLEGEQGIFSSSAKRFHLLDAADSSSLNIPLEVPGEFKFSRLTFKVGIDSAIQVAGAMGGDLDPTRGMYWSWQSGYIHFKLEGTHEDCQTRHQRFQYHIGGYRFPYATTQTVSLPINKDCELVRIEMELNSLFEQTHQCEIMSPGTTAVTMANAFPQLFSLADE